MTCDECREWMLEADPEVLSGENDSPLTLHLAICSECHEQAAAVLRADKVLRASYLQAEPKIAANVVAQRAMETGKDQMVRDAAVMVLPLPRRQVWRMIGVGVAAGLALVLMSERGMWRLNPAPGGDGKGAMASLNATMSEPNVSVDVPEGQNAIVMQTSNPNISVVWIYQ